MWGWLSPEWRRIARNVAWLLGNQVLVMVVAATVGVWVARYLGPSDYGTLSFGTSIVAISASFAVLGLEKVVVRQLLAGPGAEGEILGSALVLRVISGCVVGVGAIAAAVWLRAHDSQTRWVVAIASLSLLPQAVQVAEYWFASRVESRYAIRARIGALVASTVGRIVLIACSASVVWFAVMIVVEMAFNAGVLLLICQRLAVHLGTWTWSLRRAVALMKEGYPLLIASMATAAYLRVDQIVIRETHGAEAVGAYAAVVQMVEMTSVVSAAVVASFFPAMIKLREANKEHYEVRVQQFFDVMTWLAILIAVIVSSASGFAVRLAFGEAYGAGGPILAILVWRCVLLFPGEVLMHWLLAEGLQHGILVIVGIAGLTSVALNCCLTPTYGPTGAAVVSLVSPACALFVGPLLFPRTRRSFRYLGLAFLSPIRYPWICWVS